MKKIMCLIMVVGLLQSCYYDNKEELYQYVQDQNCVSAGATYSVDVVAAMEQYCLVCHNDTRQDGGVNLKGYDNTKLYAQAGSLYGSIIHTAPYATMPPGGGMIPQCEQDKIKAWIDGGMLNN